MRNIAKINENDRKALFHNTAAKMGMTDAIVEKDFWVCYMLDYLFHRCAWKDNIAFKGVGNTVINGNWTTSFAVVNKGTYSIQFEEAKNAGMKYFSFTPTEAGTYIIESMCMDKLALSLVDPYIGFVGTDINNNPDASSNDKTEFTCSTVILNSLANTLLISITSSPTFLVILELYY